MNFIESPSLVLATQATNETCRIEASDSGYVLSGSFTDPEHMSMIQVWMNEKMLDMQSNPVVMDLVAVPVCTSRVMRVFIFVVGHLLQEKRDVRIRVAVKDGDIYPWQRAFTSAVAPRTKDSGEIEIEEVDLEQVNRVMSDDARPFKARALYFA
jgi:hypothetical protein